MSTLPVGSAARSRALRSPNPGFAGAGAGDAAPATAAGRAGAAGWVGAGLAAVPVAGDVPRGPARFSLPLEELGMTVVPVAAALGRGIGAGDATIATAVGRAVGAAVGRTVGATVGGAVARSVGATVGRCVGAIVGRSVGISVGRSVGAAVGRSVGAMVGGDRRALRWCDCGPFGRDHGRALGRRDGRLGRRLYRRTRGRLRGRVRNVDRELAQRRNRMRRRTHDGGNRRSRNHARQGTRFHSRLHRGNGNRCFRPYFKCRVRCDRRVGRASVERLHRKNREQHENERMNEDRKSVRRCITARVTRLAAHDSLVGDSRVDSSPASS